MWRRCCASAPVVQSRWKGSSAKASRLPGSTHPASGIPAQWVHRISPCPSTCQRTTLWLHEETRRDQPISLLNACRSEERRVGKECRSRRGLEYEKKRTNEGSED